MDRVAEREGELLMLTLMGLAAGQRRQRREDAGQEEG